MSNRQAAVLASRIICAWFIYSAVLEVVAVPKLLYLVLQGYWWVPGMLKDPSVGVQFERAMFVSSLTSVFYLLVDVAVAIFFYRCGPRLIRFLTGENKTEELPEITS